MVVKVLAMKTWDNRRKDWKGISRPSSKPHSSKKGKKGYNRKNKQWSKDD